MATQIHDIWIGEDDVRRKLEGAELAAFIADREALLLEGEKHEAEVKAKADAKAALLERLGITADEAALLLG
jgi:tryptophanyl-tRNA synthetase